MNIKFGKLDLSLIFLKKIKNYKIWFEVISFYRKWNNLSETTYQFSFGLIAISFVLFKITIIKVFSNT